MIAPRRQVMKDRFWLYDASLWYGQHNSGLPPVCANEASLDHVR